MHLPVRQKLNKGIVVELDWMHPQEQEQVRALFNTVIIEGKTYPQGKPLGEEEFTAYWLSRDAFVVRAFEDSSTQLEGETVLGAFFLKPNFPGRCSHIANAGFIVHPVMRGQGIGRFMGQMVRIATSLGYWAVMFICYTRRQLLLSRLSLSLIHI